MIWSACLLLAAAGLTILEVLIPSFGILAVLAATAFGFSVVTAFREDATVGWVILGAGVLLVPLAWRIGLKVLPHTPLGRRMIPAPPKPYAPLETPVAMGAIGRALTDLRPSGAVQFDTQRVDAMSHGPFLEKGATVRVIHTEGAKVIVEALPRA
jgi:membrane-bound ClpP family serine protease